jgi:SAM-dependent methyltransferase
MIEINSPEISVDEIMEKIRKEVARRRSHMSPPANPDLSKAVRGAEHLAPIHLPRLNPHPRFETKDDGYHVNDFLRFHDRAFITNAYEGLLKRVPDSAGLSHNLDRLRRGTHSKIEILGRLRYSPEGKAKKVRVKGLLFHFGLAQAYKLPLLGYLARLGTAMIRLPIIVRNQTQFEQYVAATLQQHQEYVDSVVGSVENGFGRNAERIVELEESKADRTEITLLGERLSAFQGNLADLRSLVGDLESRLAVEDLPNQLELSGQDYLSKAIELAETPIESMKSFRGSELYYYLFSHVFYESQNVARNQVKYIDYIDMEKAKGRTILDVGCGRGEFQKILKDGGLRSIGIDINGLEVELLKEKGFDVYKADALEFLQTTTEKFYCITAFQVIEHFEKDYLRKFLKSCYEKLDSNGLLILETINPHCQIGFSSFYMDETHVRPLPPEMMVFILQWIGFKEVKLLYSNLLLEEFKGKDATRNYQNYAIIGVKK